MYNKDTIKLSYIDNMIVFLKKQKTPHEVTQLGEVDGYGFHDEGKTIKLRKLEYENIVILEQLIRIDGNDTDDYLICREFKKGKEPKKWSLEVEAK